MEYEYQVRVTDGDGNTAWGAASFQLERAAKNARANLRTGLVNLGRPTPAQDVLFRVYRRTVSDWALAVADSPYSPTALEAKAHELWQQDAATAAEGYADSPCNPTARQ